MKIAEECCRAVDVSAIKFEEGASKAIIKNTARKTFTKIQIDGCAIREERAADGALYDAADRAIIIELKGTDVAYGTKQVIAAAEFLQKSNRKPTALAGLVVGKEYPRFTSGIQRSQSKFATAFKGPLHVVTKNDEFEFEAILSFRGPHKV